MHNLWTVIWFEYLRTLKKKSFWISILAFPAIFGVIFGVMYFSNSVADQASEDLESEQFSIAYTDDSNLIQPELMSALSATSLEDYDTGQAAIKNGEYDAYYYYPPNPTEDPIEVLAQDAGLTENQKYTAVAEELLRSSASSAIDSAELVSIIRGEYQTALTTYQEGEVTPGFERVIAPGIFLVLFYALIVLLGNQMLTSTTEEKENRVIEIVLTTVEAKTLIIGKVLALILLGITQVAVIVAPVAAAYPYIKDTLEMPAIDLSQLTIDPIQMAIGATLFVLSFLLFTGLLVAIGAAVPTAKEANNFFGVAIFSMFIPLYSVAVILTDPEQLLVKIFSFFPLTAPVTLMIRNAVGNLSTVEAAIGIGVLLVTAVVALAIAVRIFKFGTLEYHRRLSLQEIFGRTS